VKPIDPAAKISISSDIELKNENGKKYKTMTKDGMICVSNFIE